LVYFTAKLNVTRVNKHLTPMAIYVIVNEVPEAL
jgi:hypothetical protein